MKRPGTFICLAVALLLLSHFGVIQAQQTGLLPFQGQLSDQAGQPLNSTLPLTLLFRIYKDAVGGPVLWEEVQPNVVTIGGRFTVLLGSHTPFGDASIFRKIVYLGITIDDGDPATTDVEMRPRQAIVPNLFATNAVNSEKLAGRDWSDLLVTGNDPSNGVIRADKIDPKLLEQIDKRVSDLEQKLQRLSEDFKREQPVGTIISSYLTWDEFSPATDNNAGDPNHANWSAQFAKWAPADGRSVAGSKFVLITHQQSVPDLRGVFLRGLNSFDPSSESSAVNATRKDPDTRARGSYQDDLFALHDHGGGDHAHQTGIWNGAATNFGGPVFRTNGEQSLADSSSWIKTSGKIIKPEGGKETRPKNIALYYYIRIN